MLTKEKINKDLENVRKQINCLYSIHTDLIENLAKNKREYNKIKRPTEFNLYIETEQLKGKIAEQARILEKIQGYLIE